MEEVKEHPYVLQCEDAKPLIVETFKFMYDLDIMNPSSGEVSSHMPCVLRVLHEPNGSFSPNHPSSFTVDDPSSGHASITA